MDDDLLKRVTAWRRQMHRYPESGFNEFRTAEFLTDELTTMGWDVTTGVGGTGVVATLARGPGPGLGLRADMDGLLITEAAEHDHISTVPGVMHACGHDGHMAMLLGAADRLTRDPDLAGTVHCVFQPAEEHGRGAQAMVDDGLFDRFAIDSMFGLHTIPGLPAGELHTREGAIMASEDTFSITVHGRGGHAARPHLVTDPLVTAAQIILGLQTVVARDVDPTQSAVLSCTDIETDGIRNAIPGTVRISGDTRSYAPGVQDLLERRIREVSAGIAGSAGATCEVDYRHEFRPTINAPRATAQAVAAAVEAVGEDRVNARCDPLMASEDFAVYGDYVPACFVFIGNGTDPRHGGQPLHSNAFDFNDDVLPAGINFYHALVRGITEEAR